MPNSLTIALSKGRILKETLPLFASAGIEPLEDVYTSRKLVFETTQPGVRFLVIRATDVPTYVSYGAADMGVAGKDVLLEHGGNGLYEPLDLQISKCRLMTCAPIGAAPAGRRLRVASKFVNITKAYFAEQGQQVDIIKLYGAMELAPLLGLADGIIDLVDSGKTLKENGLKELEIIREISTRLIVNKAALKTKTSLIEEIESTLSL